MAVVYGMNIRSPCTASDKLCRQRESRFIASGVVVPLQSGRKLGSLIWKSQLESIIWKKYPPVVRTAYQSTFVLAYKNREVRLSRRGQGRETSLRERVCVCVYDVRTRAIRRIPVRKIRFLRIAGRKLDKSVAFKRDTLRLANFTSRGRNERKSDRQIGNKKDVSVRRN